MEHTKKSILVYLDNEPMVNRLPPDQRGWLFSALLCFGRRLTENEATTMEEVLDAFPQLSSDAGLVFSFMAANILRDTRRWLGRQLSRQQYKSGGTAPTPPASNRRSPAPIPAEEKARTAREDMERMRRLMDQLRGEG